MNIIKFARVGLLSCCFALVGLTWAAETSLNAYSRSGCTIWSLGQAMPWDISPESTSANAGTQRLRKMMQAQYESSKQAFGCEPGMFMGDSFPRTGRPSLAMDQVHPVGCMYVIAPSNARGLGALRCFVDTGNRIQSYLFHALPKEKNDPEWLNSYRCIEGCTGYPVLEVYEMPWEDGDGTRRQMRAEARYNKRCIK